MILYHFTSSSHISGILRDGITEGVIPRTMTNYLLNHQWLTKNPDWFPAWGAGPSRKYHRTEHRITVEIPKTKYRNLLWWLEHGPRLVPLTMFQTLNSHDDPSDWYVYAGKIPVDWFIMIETRAHTGQRDNP